MPTAQSCPTSQRQNFLLCLSPKLRPTIVIMDNPNLQPTPIIWTIKIKAQNGWAKITAHNRNVGNPKLRPTIIQMDGPKLRLTSGTLHYGILLRIYDHFIKQDPKEAHIWPRPGLIKFSFDTKGFPMCYIKRFFNQLKELSHFPRSGETHSATLVNA